MLHEVADASTVRLHQAKAEPLCPACYKWARRLIPGLPEQETVMVQAFELAAPTYWRLQGKADRLGMGSVQEFLVHLADREGVALTRSHAVRVEDAEVAASIEEEAVRLIKLGHDNTAIARDLTTRGMKCSHEYVRRIRVARGLPTAKQYRDQAMDPKIKKMAAEGFTDEEIAAVLSTSVSSVQIRRAAKKIPSGYRTPAYWARQKEKQG